MLVFRGAPASGFGFANWAGDTCPYQQIGTGDDAICCYPGNNMAICPNAIPDSSSGGGGGGQQQQQSSSTWTNVGAGSGAAIGEFLKHFLTPQSPTCPPGAVANQAGACVPLTPMPMMPPKPWYQNPLMIVVLGGGAVLAYMMLK